MQRLIRRQAAEYASTFEAVPMPNHDLAVLSNKSVVCAAAVIHEDLLLENNGLLAITSTESPRPKAVSGQMAFG